MKDRINQARTAGFSDEEILQRIQQNADMAARIQKAKDAGFSDDEIFGRMGLQFSQQNQNEPIPENTTTAPDESLMRGIGRQLGLTGRYALEGVTSFPNMLWNSAAGVVNSVAGTDIMPIADASATADAIGLPSPETAQERVVGDVSRLMAGAGSIAGTSQMLAKGATGATQGILNTLGANAGQQVASAIGAGAAGGSAREAGAGPLVQAGAALAGGLAAPAAISTAQKIGRNIQGRVSSMRPTVVLERVKSALKQSGIDYETLPGRVQQQLQQEASTALRTGRNLDPAAMRRLADFSRIDGATPTRGMLSQDPTQVTREMNLAKQQANMSASGGRNLSQLQADNNTALVRALDNMGADSVDDAVTTGQRAIDALQRRIGGRQARINDLYSLARDSSGRSFPLDGRAFADRAIQSLDDQLAGGSLPVDVRNHINRISTGEVPFTVDYAEQLKTMIGRLQRNSSDGSARYALGLVRQALDDTPVLPLGRQAAAAGARAVNPGNLPASHGPDLGEQAIAAFNQARGANRSLMRQIERTPALRDLYEGSLAPDNFTQKYVIGSGARTADVQRLGRMLASEPTARDAVRTSITQHLKDRALAGQPDDAGIAKFSAAAYAKALKQLGDRKLSAFFAPQEIEQMHAISRVGRLMTNQPIGSAVNNSNTSAALLGRVLESTGIVGRGASRIFNVGEAINSVQSGFAQRAAQQTLPAITVRPSAPQVDNRLIPASLYGALLSSGVPSSQN